MRFYQQQHVFYCGVDLHAKTMHICIIDQAGKILVHRNLRTSRDAFLNALAPYRRRGIVVGVECMFAWYWLADLCAEYQIAFVLGHALYMKAIHGGKSKTDKIDSEKIARLLRGGTFPMAYVYPAAMRATRDLLRRRTRLVRTRAEALAHIQNTLSQYNLPALGKKLTNAANRVGVAEQFQEPSVRASIEADLALIGHLDEQIGRIELYLTRHAKIDDPQTYHRLRTVPGVGPVLSLILLYEIHEIARFGGVGQFVSYARLVRCSHESAGKKSPGKGRKIGNAHLKWAFSEAACLLIREVPGAAAFVARKEKKHGKAKALSILAAKLGRAVYWMLKRREAFDVRKLFGGQAGEAAPMPAGQSTVDLSHSCRSRSGEKERGARGASTPVSAPGSALGSVPTGALSSAQAEKKVARKTTKATTATKPSQSTKATSPSRPGKSSQPSKLNKPSKSSKSTQPSKPTTGRRGRARGAELSR
jgi:transposase